MHPKVKELIPQPDQTWLLVFELLAALPTGWPKGPYQRNYSSRYSVPRISMYYHWCHMDSSDFPISTPTRCATSLSYDQRTAQDSSKQKCECPVGQSPWERCGTSGTLSWHEWACVCELMFRRLLLCELVHEESMMLVSILIRLYRPQHVQIQHERYSGSSS